MSDAPTPQTIDLDTPHTLCVFDKDGNPFYSVSGMATMLAMSLAQRVNRLDEATDADNAYIAGQLDLIQHIGDQAECLRGVYQASKVETVEDLLRLADGRFE